MSVRIIQGDCRELLSTMPDESVSCVVTSPPYWQLRDYGHLDQLGLEATPELYVKALVDVFREVRRVLHGAGTLWLNLGDTYIGGRTGGIGKNSKLGSQRNHRASREAWKASGGRTHRTCPGYKPKDLVGIPWRVALALQADGWWLRSDIVWSKPSPMPERVLDRPTRAHEYVFLLSRSERYHYDAEAIAEPLAEKTYTAYGTKRQPKGNDSGGGVRADNMSRSMPDRKPRIDDHGNQVHTRKRRSVWTIAQEPFKEAHFSTSPTKLVEPCILAGCPQGGIVMDPFAGAGTVGLVADRLGRDAILLELNPGYCEMARRLIKAETPLTTEVTSG